MKQIIWAMLLVAGVNTSVFAQQHTGDVNVKDVRIEKTGSILSVSFKSEIGKKAAKSNYRLVLTPVLYNINDSTRLKQIVVETRKSKIVQRREQISAGKHATATEASEGYGVANNAILDYSYTVPYQEWMNGSSLRLERLLCGCCTEHNFAPLPLAGNLALIPPSPVIEIPKVRPEIRKWAFSKADMIIDFAVSKTNIDLDLFDNREILGEVVDVLRKLADRQGDAIDKVEITGYASPEGNRAFNRQLGEGRSLALKQYLREQIPQLPDSAFCLINGEENWGGLRRMVEASDMKYKDEVLYIIDNVPVEVDTAKDTSRKKQLMELKGGVPYMYMLKNFFPKLRNACYIGVYYLDDKGAE